MKDHGLIPATPAEEDYARAAARAEGVALAAGGEPIALFQQWLAEANTTEKDLANAMALASVDADGLPDCRMVLLKGVDARGFTFYTNTESAKGEQLAANSRAALCFHWKQLGRQVRARGPVESVSAEEADAYFATRAHSAQIGAWASDQSRPLEGPRVLERRIAEAGVKFGLRKVPRPPHWSGYRLLPASIEFWRERPFRLHQRLLFERRGEGWSTRRLFP
jgi:pyridoxamine 5'-phosphate oxidase